MKDRFKFRVYVNENENYPEKIGYVDTEDFCVHPDGDIGFFNADYDYAEYVIEQCTGLKDKNGKLIYEGDIIRCQYKTEFYDGVVVWDKDEAGFSILVDGELYSFTQRKDDDITIILGNIHENPKLLKEEQ